MNVPVQHCIVDLRKSRTWRQGNWSASDFLLNNHLLLHMGWCSRNSPQTWYCYRRRRNGRLADNTGPMVVKNSSSMPRSEVQTGLKIVQKSLQSCGLKREEKDHEKPQIRPSRGRDICSLAVRNIKKPHRPQHESIMVWSRSIPVEIRADLAMACMKMVV